MSRAPTTARSARAPSRSPRRRRSRGGRTWRTSAIPTATWWSWPRPPGELARAGRDSAARPGVDLVEKRLGVLDLEVLAEIAGRLVARCAVEGHLEGEEPCAFGGGAAGHRSGLLRGVRVAVGRRHRLVRGVPHVGRACGDLLGLG